MNKEFSSEIKQMKFMSFPQIFKRMQELSVEYGGMGSQQLISAFTKAGMDSWGYANPYIQNRRVKQISSLPRDYSKDQVGEMIVAPDENEQGLREVAHGLEYTAYPMFHIRKEYQEMLTYHSYIYPRYTTRQDAKTERFWREWKMAEKIREKMQPKESAHKIVGQALVEGKVFYTPRVRVDKSHNQVDYAFLQQLPSDWVKIVGFNNASKYTVAFNLFYFLQPGTDPLQFGDLLTPYLEQFYDLLEWDKKPTGLGKTVVYAQKSGINYKRAEELRKSGKLRGNAEYYYQNGMWYYWVTMPVDRVFTFEIDDVVTNVVSPFTGLFLSMIQIAQYEQIQLELVQNPLVALVTGEIPYRDDRSATADDMYKLSNAGRELFLALWQQMLAEYNTSGIGLYMAPLQNMTLHTLSEAPSSIQVSSRGYEYTIDKAGLAGIIPVGDSARAGVAQISFKIESKFAQLIYSQYERMMEVVLDKVGFKYQWRMKMFGTISEDAEMEESARKGMTLGILPETLRYLALYDLTILDDLAQSGAVAESGILETRIPLVTSYSAKNPESGLPPQAQHDMNPGGRPESDSEPQSEGQEQDEDSYGG